MIPSRSVVRLLSRVAAVSVLAACSDDPSGPGPLVSVTVEPATAAVQVGATLQLRATLRNAAGQELTGRPVVWTTSGAAVAAVSDAGLVTGVSGGQVIVTASAEGIRGEASLVVFAPLVASEPVVVPGLSARWRGAPGAVRVGGPATYVSLAAGVAPNGVSATVRNVTTGSSVTTAVVSGGVDPTPVAASVGDSIEVVVQDNNDSTVAVSGIRVPARRAPVVIRTVPPRGGTDVPLNARILIVFSEPIDSVTLGPSVLLLKNGAAIAGSVRFLDATLLNAEFVPSASLDPLAQYRFRVTTSARDLDGDPLESEATVDFSTAASATSAVSISLSPAPVSIVVGGSASLVVTLRDAAGNVLAGRPVTWSSSIPAVASVSGTGRVTGVAPGTATVTASSEGLNAVAAVTVLAANNFSALAVGESFSCALVVSGAAYCWGAAGLLGDGTTNGSLVPAAVAGGLTFTSLVAGQSHTCGLAASGSAYCWGSNGSGQLGIGTFDNSLLPIPVSGALNFTALTAGQRHTCGLTGSGVAYCWGENASKQGGVIGGDTSSRQARPIPTVVADGSLTFASLSAGAQHTCGVALNGSTYCWGANAYGQVGGGTAGSATNTPVVVSGGLTFVAVSAGGGHTCGLTVAGVAYCWGYNGDGELGNPTVPRGVDGFSAVPVIVSGGLTFAQLSAGALHTCGATSSAAWCWGSNANGQLGIGTTLDAAAPTVVSGSLSFTKVQAGAFHTCGIATGAVAYCWGANASGQLGDGSTAPSTVRVRVAGQP